MSPSFSLNLSASHLSLLAALILPALPSMAGGITFESFQAAGASSTQAEAFCGGNKIVGGIIDNSGSPSGAVMGVNGKSRPFSLPNAKTTRPHACYRGQMLGAAFYGKYGQIMKGFAATGSGVVNLLPPDGSNASAQGMNAAGTIVGLYAAGSRGYNSGFIYKDGVYTRYDLPGASGTQIMGIAEDGTMVGSYIAKNTGQSSGFVDHAGNVSTIHVPGSYDTMVTGMSADGVLVGYFNTALGGNHQGFYFKNGEYVVFSPAGALDTYVWSIDEAGRVVGYSYYENYGQAAFVAHLTP